MKRYIKSSLDMSDRNRLKPGMIITHTDFEFPLKITECYFDADGNVSGIEVHDYQGTGHYYDLWIDNSVLRRENRSGSILKKISIVK